MSEADGQAGGGKVHHLADAAALSYLDVALQALKIRIVLSLGNSPASNE